MDSIRSRIRPSRAMTAIVPPLTLSIELALGIRDRPDIVNAVLASLVAACVAAFIVSQFLERSSLRRPKTCDLHTDEYCRGARARKRAGREPGRRLGVFLLALGLGLIPLGTGTARAAMAPCSPPARC